MATLRKHPGVSVALVVLTLAFSSGVRGADFAGGTGEPNDPYQIATMEQLLAVTSGQNLTGKCFRLAADIDAAGMVFSTPVVPVFSGTFDGNGHAVRNLRVRGIGDLGLFGEVRPGGRVLNLSVSDADALGTLYAGALVGRNAGTIERCDSTGFVAGMGSGTGGLVGYNQGTVTGSRSAADVLGDSDAGGLVGANTGFISDCTTTGSIFANGYAGGLVGNTSGGVSTSCSSASVTASSNVGGLVGRNTGGIMACYSTGSAWGSSHVGGLVGYNSGGWIRHCYTSADVIGTSGWSVGYLVGTTYYADNVTACYFVMGNTPDVSAAVGTALTTGQMKQRTSFVGWDFWDRADDGIADVWFMPPDAYPVLAWQTDTTGLVAIPNVMGLSLDQARVPLTAAGLTTGIVTQDYHRVLPAGSVIRTYPRSFALPSSEIALVLSMGGNYDWTENLGKGSVGNPYLIASPGQLESLGDHSELWNKCFALTANLDMSGRTYATALIAPDVNTATGFQGTTFTGSFYGNKYAIENLRISNDSSAPGTYYGLFGLIDNAGQVFDLSLKDVTITTATSPSSIYVGSLAGFNNGTVADCSSTGVITTGTSSTAGGLVGHNHGTTVNSQTEVIIVRPNSGGTTTRSS